METRQIHVRDLSTVTGIQQYEHCVQSIFFLGLEDFEGTIYLSLESDKFSENVALTNNTFIIGQPMTKFNVTYTCQIYGIVGTGEKIQLSKQFRMAVYKSNNISGETGEYPIDPNIKNAINLYIDQKEKDIDNYVDQVIDRIPADYATLEQATYNAYPTQSETGNPIYFDDGAEDIPVKELIVNLEPKQEGTGDPSPTNVRPISGYDGVVVKRVGKNLIKDTPRDIGTFSGVTVSVNDKGQFVLNGTATANNSVRVGQCTLPSGEYELTGMTQTGSSSTFFINITPRFTGSNDQNLYSGYYRGESTDELTYTIRIYWRSGQVFNNMIFEPMIRLASVTDSTFEPYQCQEYSITFPSEVGTVYGGSLNVTTGVLTVDRFIAQLKWSDFPLKTVIGTYERRQKTLFSNESFVYPPSANKPQVSNVAPYNVNYQRDEFGFYFNSRQLTMFLPVGTSEDLDVQAICELRTPTTVQLTPTEVSTLLGSNTIQSDGSMDLQYRADTTMVIEKLTNAIISMGGNV